MDIKPSENTKLYALEGFFKEFTKLYNDKKIDPVKTPNPIPFSSPKLRVNFYGSHKLICPDTE